MENNIDKILRNALENHEEMPPSESWMHIHTEIAKQNRRVLTPILVGLLLGVLLISGLGISMYYASKSDEKLIVVSLNSKPLFIPKNIQNSSLKEVLSYKNNQVMAKGQFLPLSVSSQTTIGLSSVETQTTAENFVQNLEEKPLKNDSMQYFSEIKENVNLKINKIQPVELLAKSYVYTDLFEKMNKALVGKIDENYLEEKSTETDSVTEEIVGKKFSLKHPIISFGFGTSWSNWNMDGYDYYNQFIDATTKGAVLKLGLAWKLSKKARIAFNFKLNGLGNIDINHLLPPQSASVGGSTLTLTQINSDLFYTEITPFGNVNIPASLFKDWDVNQINQPSLISNVFYNSPHSIRTFQTDVNIEYDLSSYKRKKGFSYQFYGIGGVNVQRQMNYSYNTANFFVGSSSLNPPTTIPKVFFEAGHLQNGAEFILGANIGLGFRWQFAKKWSLNLETLGQTSLNSWIKNFPFTTKQTMYSLQGGIQLNL